MSYKRPDYSKSRFARYDHREGKKRIHTVVVPASVYEDPISSLVPEIWDNGKDSSPNGNLVGKYDTKEKITQKLRRDSGWFGDLKSYEDIQRKLRDGHKPGLEKIQKLMTSVREVANNNRKEIRNRRRVKVVGPEGDSFNYDRFRQGGIDVAWSTKKRRARGQAPIISLGFLSGVNCLMKEEEMSWRPAVALALTEMLSEMGYHVELTQIQVNKLTYDVNKVWCQRVVLKAADEPLRLQALSMATHVGIFRTIGFMMMGLHDTDISVDCSLGQMWLPDDKPFDSYHDLSKMGFEGLPVLIPCCYSEAQAKVSLQKTIEKLK